MLRFVTGQMLPGYGFSALAAPKQPWAVRKQKTKTNGTLNTYRLSFIDPCAKGILGFIVLHHFASEER